VKCEAVANGIYHRDARGVLESYKHGNPTRCLKCPRTGRIREVLEMIGVAECCVSVEWKRQG
jgi:hypothetical protein